LIGAGSCDWQECVADAMSISNTIGLNVFINKISLSW
jgi:hypothetical protein